jgi:hypothetical protein
MTAMLGLVSVMMSVTMVRRRRLSRRFTLTVTARRHFRSHSWRRWRWWGRRRVFFDRHLILKVVTIVANVTLRRRRPRPFVFDEVFDAFVHSAHLVSRRRRAVLVIAGVRVRVLEDPLRRPLAAAAGTDLRFRLLDLGDWRRVSWHFVSIGISISTQICW